MGERGAVARIYRNLARLLGGKAGAGLVSLAYLALAARALGPGDYGVLVLVHAYAMTVGGIVEFPGWHAIVRYGSQAETTGDKPRLARLIAFAGLVEAAGGASAVAVAAVLAPLLGPRLGWSPTAIAFALPYSFAVLASIRSTPAGYLQLVGRFDLLAAHSLVAPCVRLAGAAAAILAHAGLKGFLVAWLAAALIEWAAMWALGLYAARGRLSRRDFAGGMRGVLRENPGLWRFMLAANADVTVTELAARAPPLVVGWVLGAEAAGLFAVAQRITSVLAQPALILGQAAYVELSRMVAAQARHDQLFTAVRRAVAFAWLAAAPIWIAVALFGRQIAAAVAGPRFAAAAGVMLWLATARALQLAAPPLSAALTALGRPGRSMLANLASGLGLLLALPPMLGWLGLNGAGAHALLQAVAVVGLLTFSLTAHPGAARARELRA
jgi:O-antigen/teichoic acid export membrane protein